MIPLKVWLYIAALAALAALAFFVHRWDQGRLDAAYARGEAAERKVWTDALNVANVEQAKANQQATVASEQAADRATAQNQRGQAEVAAQTQSTVETIIDEHQQQPAPVCAPGGRPGPVQPGVLQALDAARSAALGKG